MNRSDSFQEGVNLAVTLRNCFGVRVLLFFVRLDYLLLDMHYPNMTTAKNPSPLHLEETRVCNQWIHEHQMRVTPPYS